MAARVDASERIGAEQRERVGSAHFEGQLHPSVCRDGVVELAVAGLPELGVTGPVNEEGRQVCVVVAHPYRHALRSASAQKESFGGRVVARFEPGVRSECQVLDGELRVAAEGEGHAVGLLKIEPEGAVDAHVGRIAASLVDDERVVADSLCPGLRQGAEGCSQKQCKCKFFHRGRSQVSNKDRKNSFARRALRRKVLILPQPPSGRRRNPCAVFAA